MNAVGPPATARDHCHWRSALRAAVLARDPPQPQLHTLVYGFHQHQFTQSIRLGWRPTVFLQHGLAVNAWMAASTVAAFGLWRARLPLPRLGLPGLAVFAVYSATLFVKSVGSIALMVIGLAALL